MKILLTGGGTGGHITPILAVAHELKRLNPDTQLIYVGEKHGKFAELTRGQAVIDQTYTIYAGKFRRYHGETWLQRFLDIQTILLNFRDLFYFFFGTVQSFFLLKKLQPDVVFLKGGFVGVPIGLSSAFWRIPFVTHDSDALPGLANRITARWARFHATGMPPEFYKYPKESVKYTGVLVSEDYQPIDSKVQKSYKADLNLPAGAPLLVVTGGSLGAQIINTSMSALVPHLLKEYPSLHIIHQVGKGKTGVYGPFKDERLTELEFLQPMYKYLGAADVVVTRAGGNTMAELAMQGRACIVVPNPWLTGGHQLENAKHFQSKEAIAVVSEADLKQNPNSLGSAIRSLLDDDKKRHVLGKNIQTLAVPDAAERLAMVLLEVAGDQKKHVPKQKTNTT